MRKPGTLHLHVVCGILIASVLAGGVDPVQAQDPQQRIQGRVVDTANQPVAGVQVTCTRIDPPDRLARAAVTNASGAFALAVPPGAYQCRASTMGFTSTSTEVRVSAGESTTLVFQVASATAPLIGMTASRYFNLFHVNYFTLGSDFGGDESRDPLESADQIKFHVALRYKLIDWRKCGDCRAGIYASYSQSSFWHLWDDSAPFFDNNYSPGALAYVPVGKPAQEDKGGPAVFGGLFHESNGRDLSYSRGWNRLLIGASLGAVNRTRISGSVSAWHTMGLEPTNPDLEEYAGRGEIELFLQPFLKDSAHTGPVSLQLRSRVFGRQPVTNVEANLLIHLSGASERWFTPSLLIQVFSGYAENLLTYDKNRTVVRAGLGIMR